MKIKVKSCGNTETFTEEEVLREAVVKYLLKHRSDNNFSLGVIMECTVEIPKRKPKSYLFNTYYMLKLAKMNKYAEKMRSVFLKQYGVDLREEATMAPI